WEDRLPGDVHVVELAADNSRTHRNRKLLVARAPQSAERWRCNSGEPAQAVAERTRKPRHGDQFDLFTDPYRVARESDSNRGQACRWRRETVQHRTHPRRDRGV